MVRLGQHAAPSHTIVHLSDPHLLAASRLHGEIDTVERLAAALERLEASTIRPDAIVVTGDLVELGEPAAYQRLRELLEPVAARLGAVLVWCMGNHDERAPFARLLHDDPTALGEGSHGIAPQDRVAWIDGLRLIALDTSVPGYHHGALEPAQLEWLAEELRQPAPHGTIIAMHHPPMPTPLLEAMAVLELEDQAAFAEVVRGTDVRGILAGHLHVAAHSSLEGIPVSVAAATCSSLALGQATRVLASVDRHQSFDAVHVYPDRIVHTTVPIAGAPLLSGFPVDALERIAAMDSETRRELLSSKAAVGGLAALLGETPGSASLLGD